MKSYNFFATALLAYSQLANAANQRVDGFAGLVSTGTQTAATSTVILKDYTTQDTIWSIDTMSYYEHDTGYEWVVVTHYLTEWIAADDKITFSLAFQTSYDPWTNPKDLMVMDVGQCELQLNANDIRFWDQTPYDKYIACDEYTCASTDISSNNDAWMTGTVTTKDDSQSDWYCNMSDDDPDNPFCTALTSTDTYYDDDLYVCKQIKCIHQRMKETWDPNSQDFMFDETADTQTMILPKRQSTVTIQKTTDSTGYPVPSVLSGDTSITIYKSATALSAAALVTSAIAL